MPSTGVYFWLSLPVVLVALIYQLGLPAFIGERLPNLRVTTHCYKSVKTLSPELLHLDCFTVNDGLFSSVFAGHASSDEAKEVRTGYVYPGLWDGHGHLIQFGESLDSVGLFSASSMAEVQERLLEYKMGRPDEGTSDQWLRGVGWDQAHFGQWPTSVRVTNTFMSQSPLGQKYRTDFMVSHKSISGGQLQWSYITITFARHYGYSSQDSCLMDAVTAEIAC